MRVLSVLVLILLPPLAGGGEIYKSRDEQGRVIYSDQPSPGATPVTLPEPNTTPAETPRPPQPEAKQPAASAAAASVSISSPADQAIIPNGLAPQRVTASVNPPLEEGEEAVLLVDGAAYVTSTNLQFTIPQLSRGQHRLQVITRDAYGDTIAESPVHTIFVYWPGGN